jgi:hypothetical protein
MSSIRCALCLMLAIRPKEGGFFGRKSCFCIHPDAHGPHTLKSVPRFISFTRLGRKGFKLKAAPSWCPEKAPARILEVSSSDADVIIIKREPRGLFFLREDGVYVGIDNLTGDAWVEEFNSLAACKKWLLGADLG